MNDKEIIEAIRRGDRERPIKFLYKEFPKIERLIVQSGCNKQLAHEIFNDSLILLIEKIESPRFELTSKITTYLYGINRFLVKNELKKQRRSRDLEWKDTLIISDSDLAYKEDVEHKLKLVESLLGQITEKCQQIFRLFYFERKSMQIIAEELGYSSTNSAKTQKYKCIEKTLKLARESNVSPH